jgi:hypothetical protein
MLYKTVFALGCVLADGEPANSTRGRAKTQAGPISVVRSCGGLNAALLPQRRRWRVFS